MDGTFPKFAGVGKPGGSPTQRLVHWLVDTFAKKADLWLDLHGGTRTETIASYLWAWETGVLEIDSDVRKFIIAHTPKFGIFERQLLPVGKAATLARAGCGYIQGESGGSGPRQENDILHHETWIMAALGFMGIMGPANPSRRTRPVIYQNVDYIRCKKSGLWFPSDTTIRMVRKGETLGVIRSMDGKNTETLHVAHTGQLLWIKDGLRALPTDDLAAIAHNPSVKI